ncbi:TPA: IS630 transposase-related protein [Streptococcus pneumoniae]
MDFRKKVLSYCERTGSITEASHVFQISRNTIYGWLKLKEKTGELNHQVKGTKPRKVDRDRLKNYLTDNPDAYLTEIASDFGVIQLPSTMRSKLWATLEKKNHTYYEQDPEKVALFLKNFNSLKHLAPV